MRRLHLKPAEQWVAELNQLSFVFPTGGGGHYVSRSVTHRLSPGDVLVLKPTCEGGVRADEGGDLDFSFFSVNPEHLFPLFAMGEISLLQNVCEGFKATKLHGCATVLARECHRRLTEVPPQFNLDHRSQLLRVVAAILDAEIGTAPPHLPGFVRAEDHLRQVLEELSVDALTSLSVPELAGRFGCSRRHLSRLFHKHFGLSVAALKMELRLLKALSLLRDPDAKIISVAEQCGFDYLGRFNTFFRKRFGTTPSQRRKLMSAAEGQPVLRPDRGPVHLLRSNWVFAGLLGDPDHQPPSQVGPAETRELPSAKLMITANLRNGLGAPERRFRAGDCDARAVRRVAATPV